jgi:Spy/CpxP family protein refolding chaperone
MGGMLLACMLMAGTALAQQPAPSMGRAPHDKSFFTQEDRAAMRQIFWQRAQERLGLSDQQAAEIRALLDGQRTAMRANVQNLKATRKQLQSLLEQPTVDLAAVQSAAAQLKTQQAALFDARLQTQIAIRAKLTPEQWEQWQTLRRGSRHHGMRHGPGFGRM